MSDLYGQVEAKYQEEMLQFEQEMQELEAQIGLENIRKDNLLQQGGKKFGKFIGAQALKHYKFTYALAKGTASVGASTVHGLEYLGFVPKSIRGKIEMLQKMKAWAEPAGNAALWLVEKIQKQKLRRILEFSLKVEGNEDYKYLGDLDAYRDGISIVNNKSLDAVTEEQKQLLMETNRRSFLELQTNRTMLAFTPGPNEENDMVTDYDYLKKLPAFVVPRQKGFWGKLNIVDYFRHKNAEKAARESEDAKAGTLESRVYGFKALDLSEKEVDYLASGVSGKFKALFGRLTKSGKAVADHKRLIPKVERNQVVYQEEMIQGYTKLHSRLSNSRDLLQSDSRAVIDAFKGVIFEKKEDKEIFKVDESSIYFDKKQSGNSANNPALEEFSQTFKLFTKVKSAMESGDMGSIVSNMEEYQSITGQNFSSQGSPVYHKYFATRKNIRILAEMPEYAQMLLFSCVSERLFHAVNHYGSGSRTIDMKQFGKLAANYRISRLAADAVVNRRDFKAAFAENSAREDEKEALRVNKLTDWIIAKAGEEYAFAFGALRSKEALNNPLTASIYSTMVEVGAINKLESEAVEGNAAINKFYDENIAPLIQGIPSKESDIRKYLRENKSEQIKGVKKAEDILVNKIKNKMGLSFIFARNLENIADYYEEDDTANTIVANYTERMEAMYDEAGALSILSRKGFDVTPEMLLTNKAYEKILTEDTSDAFTKFHENISAQILANIDAVHSAMDMKNILMRMNERKVINNIGMLMLNGSATEVRQFAVDEFAKIFKEHKELPAVGEFLKASLTAALKVEDGFSAYEEQLISKFLIEYEKDETRFQAITKEQIVALFANWVQQFREKDESTAEMTRSISVRFQDDLEGTEGIGVFVRDAVSISEAMELLKTSKGFEFLSDMHGAAEHLNLEEYEKVKNEVIKRVKAFIFKFENEGESISSIKNGLRYKCVKAAIKGINEEENIWDILLEISKDDLVDTKINEETYAENLNQFKGIIGARMLIPFELIEATMLKDKEYINAMNTGGESLQEYALYFMNSYEKLFSNAAYFPEDLIGLYFSVNYDVFSKKIPSAIDEEKWKKQIEDFDREIGQRVIDGKSLDELLKEGTEDKTFNTGEKISILSMLVANGKINYTELYDAATANERLLEYKAIKQANLKALGKVKGVEKEVLRGFKEKYAVDILTEKTEDFEAELATKLESVRVYLSEHSGASATSEELDVTALQKEVEERIAAGNQAYHKDWWEVEAGRTAYHRGASPIAYAYRKFEDTSAEDLDDAELDALVYLSMDESQDLSDMARYTSINSKLLGELFRLGIAQNDGYFIKGNLKNVVFALNKANISVTKILQDITSESRKGMTEEERKEQDKLFDEERYRFLVYLISQKKLTFAETTYKPGLVGSTLNGLHSITSGIWNRVTGANGPKEDLDKTMMTEYESYRIRQSEVDNLEFLKNSIRDQDLLSQLSAEILPLQMAMFNMKPDEFSELVKSRANYFIRGQFVKDVVNELVAPEYTNLDEKTRKTYLRSVGINVLSYLQVDIHNAVSKEDLRAKIETMFSAENKAKYLKVFNTEASRKVFTMETKEEQATVTGDIGMLKFAEILDEFGEEYISKYKNMSTAEQKAFVLALTLPIRYTEYDRVGSVNAIKSGVKINEQGKWENRDDSATVTQREVYRIVELLRDDSQIEGQTYEDAYIKLWYGDTEEANLRAKQLFDQCYLFIKHCSEELAINERDDWKKIQDPTESIMLAKRLGKVEGMDASVRDRDGFVERVKASLGEDNELVKRLSECADFSILVTILQNRSILDKSTDDERLFANEIMRKEITRRFCASSEKAALSFDMRNSTKAAYISQALYSLCSYQVKDESLAKEGTLTERDLVKDAMDRETRIDTKLLGAALDYVELLAKKKEELSKNFDVTYSKYFTNATTRHKTTLSEDGRKVLEMIDSQLVKEGARADFSIFTDRTESLVDRMVSDFNQTKLRELRAQNGEAQ